MPNDAAVRTGHQITNKFVYVGIANWAEPQLADLIRSGMRIKEVVEAMKAARRLIPPVRSHQREVLLKLDDLIKHLEGE